MGQDPDEALELIRQWLPSVWEAWYFCMPRPELLQAPPVVARPGAGVRCWEGAVGCERLYRAAVAIVEDWYARRVPVRMMRDAPEFCSRRNESAADQAWLHVAGRRASTL